MYGSTTSKSDHPKRVMIDYLRNREEQLFPTPEYTFHHCTEVDRRGKLFEGSHEWRRWVMFVGSFANQFDHQHHVSVLRAFYRHLAIGWLLSAVTFQIEHGPVRDRRHRHAWYAGWRTFDAAFDDQGDSSFTRDPELHEIPSVLALHEYLLGIICQWRTLMESVDDGSLRDTEVSDAFIKGMLPEMQRLIRIEYAAACAQARDLVGGLEIKY